MHKNKETLPLSEAGSLVWSLIELLFFLRVLLLESFDAPFGIDNFLRPREKRMTV